LACASTEADVLSEERSYPQAFFNSIAQNSGPIPTTIGAAPLPASYNSKALPDIKNTSIPTPGGRGAWDEDADEEEAQPLTRAQAQALRAKIRLVSPQRILAIQALAGSLVAAVCWGATSRIEFGGSALYGAAVAVVPTALMAWGTGRLRDAGAAVSVVRFMVWEGVKVLLAIAMLFLASRVVPQLSWPALLVALVVCLKVTWLAPLWRGRNPLT
jgi:ATP synthase protein I